MAETASRSRPRAVVPGWYRHQGRTILPACTRPPRKLLADALNRDHLHLPVVASHAIGFAEPRPNAA
jgi:hypothetical protein